MAFVFGIVIMIAVSWAIYGVLSALDVEDAGNIAAYSAMGLIVLFGLGSWIREEAAKKACPDCRSELPGDAAVCRYCGYRFGHPVVHD